MTKPFLVIQLRPEDTTADDELAAIKRHGGLSDDEVMRVRAEVRGLPDIALDDLSAIIVGGSPLDVSTPEDRKSDIQKTIEAGFSRLFRAIEEQDFPFLGCCSGNSLLGSYCGATISRRYGEPVGGADVHLTPAGLQDPLLAGFPETIRVLLGHKEACDDLPPGTVLLAGNEHCPVQMFRLKRNVYATQFHPEGDAPGFRTRIDAYKDYGYFDAGEADSLSAGIALERTPEANLILRRFVDRYRR